MHGSPANILPVCACSRQSADVIGGRPETGAIPAATSTSSGASELARGKKTSEPIPLGPVTCSVAAFGVQLVVVPDGAESAAWGLSATTDTSTSLSPASVEPGQRASVPIQTVTSVGVAQAPSSVMIGQARRTPSARLHVVTPLTKRTPRPHRRSSSKAPSPPRHSSRRRAPVRCLSSRMGSKAPSSRSRCWRPCC